MSEFPRTMVGGVSMPRLICGSNWLLGFSHTSRAKDRFIKEYFNDPSKVADVIEVFARNGCNAFMSMYSDFTRQALDEVEQRTGREMIWICTPGFKDTNDFNGWKQSVDECKAMRATFCFPHQYVTDARLDTINQCLNPELTQFLAYVREMEMIPGLSAHRPEAVTCADACNADVETYIQIYNAAGFLCQVETDWIQKLIHGAKKPVMTIKPLAAGRLLPPTGLAFSWSTIRDCDMVTVGTMSPYEAEEVIEISLALLERREADVDLQFTRSKKSLTYGQ
ncbi:MAG: aldo-keto reductase family protein [Armatimonadota bacterium]